FLARRNAHFRGPAIAATRDGRQRETGFASGRGPKTMKGYSSPLCTRAYLPRAGENRPGKKVGLNFQGVALVPGEQLALDRYEIVGINIREPQPVEEMLRTAQPVEGSLPLLVRENDRNDPMRRIGGKDTRLADDIHGVRDEPESRPVQQVGYGRLRQGPLRDKGHAGGVARHGGKARPDVDDLPYAQCRYGSLDFGTIDAEQAIFDASEAEHDRGRITGAGSGPAARFPHVREHGHGRNDLVPAAAFPIGQTSVVQ